MTRFRPPAAPGRPSARSRGTAPGLASVLALVVLLALPALPPLPALPAPPGLPPLPGLPSLPGLSRAVAAQDARIGITLAGTGLVGLSVELLDGNRALELSVGTWAFRDVGVSVVAKERFGAAALRPMVGLGLWTVFSFPPASERDPRQNGISVLARAPFGFDWNAGGEHHLEAAVNMYKALWIRRTRPGEDIGVSPRIIPFPGLAYRWAY